MYYRIRANKPPVVYKKIGGLFEFCIFRWWFNQEWRFICADMVFFLNKTYFLLKNIYIVHNTSQEKPKRWGVGA